MNDWGMDGAVEWLDPLLRWPQMFYTSYRVFSVQAACSTGCLLFRLLVCRLARPGDWLMTLLALNSVLLLATITILRLSSFYSIPNTLKKLQLQRCSLSGRPKLSECRSSPPKLSPVSLFCKELSQTSSPCSLSSLSETGDQFLYFLGKY